MKKTERILSLVKAGVSTSGAIAKEIGCPSTQVVSLLAYLERKGRVRRGEQQVPMGKQGKRPFLYSALPEQSDNQFVPGTIGPFGRGVYQLDADTLLSPEPPEAA